MTYNGWANYETWNVALWLDNDPISYHYAKIAKDYNHYRELKVTRTGDGVSLWDPILDTKELDHKIKELKPCLTDEVTLNDYLGAQAPFLTAMLKIRIKTDNQAFDQEGQEVARILRDLADKLEHLDELQESQLPLRDLNGNTVGYYQTWTDQGESQGAVISSPYATWSQ